MSYDVYSDPVWNPPGIGPGISRPRPTGCHWPVLSSFITRATLADRREGRAGRGTVPARVLNVVSPCRTHVARDTWPPRDPQRELFWNSAEQGLETGEHFTVMHIESIKLKLL